MKYRPELDGLRAFAVAGVMGFHGYYEAFTGGWIGVDIFFVLSGFLITSLLVSEREATGSIALGRFYVRRALRLGPAFMVVILAVALVEYVLKREPASDAGWSLLVASTYMMDWNLAFGWGGVGVLAHCWSLAVEEQFYLLWPLALLVVPARTQRRATIAALLLVVGWKIWLIHQDASPARVYAGFDTHADTLLIGCLLAQIAISPVLADRARQRWLIPIALLLVFALVLPFVSAFAMTAGILLVGLCTSWLIVASGSAGGLKTILSHSAPVYLGRISYGIYLWHGVLLSYARPFLSPALNIVPLLLAVPAAALSYHLVEQPILRWRDRRQSVAGGLPFAGFGFFVREREA